MANVPQTLRVAELDFNQIRENLKKFLRNQSEFQDFDFEGSGLSILIELLAYNTHYLGIQANMEASEAFLDSAQLRESIISHAKHIQYTPTSCIGATTQVDITVTPGASEDTQSTALTIFENTQFMSSPVNGNSYNFNTIQANTSYKSNGTFFFPGVWIKQGEPINRLYQVTPDNPYARFNIPTANIDLTTISVQVQESLSNSNIIVYSQAEDITEITGNSTVFFVEELPSTNGAYTIYFGDNVLGQQLANNNLVYVQYLDTQGSYPNGANTFTPITLIGGKYSAKVVLSSHGPAFGGAFKESIESIRFRAPIHYTTQNRSVTEIDYQSLILKDFPNIRAVSVWGGEKNIPIVYGKVFASLLPVDNYFLSLQEKQNIISQITKKRSILTIIPEIVDPVFTYYLIKGQINYNPTVTPLSENSIQALINAAISDFNDQYLITFNSVFYKSKLQESINNTDQSILGSFVNIYLQERLTPQLGSSFGYTIKFNTPLARGSATQKLYTFPSFSVLDSTNIPRDCYIEEIPDFSSGISSIDLINPGYNYLVIPDIIITGDGSGAVAKANIVNGKVVNITILNPGINYTFAIANIQNGGGKGATCQVNLQNNFGNLRLYYYLSTGEKVILNNNIGTIDYQNGIITLSSINIKNVASNQFYGENIITFNICPENDIIYSQQNQILLQDTLDSSAIQLSLNAVNK